MADNETKKCLNDWGFGDLIDQFSEQEIDFDCLKSLSKDLIKELIPTVGKRIQFLNKWKNKFAATQDISSIENVIDSGQETSPTASQSQILDSTEEQEEANLSSSIEAHTVDNKRLFTGESEYRKRIKNFNGDYLSDLLNKRSNLSELLFGDYKLNRDKLSAKASFMLCDCIANDLVLDCHSKFTTQDYVDLTDQIVKRFPSEQSHTYFRPGIPKKFTKNKKSKKPGGRLYDKIKNKKALYAALTGKIRRKNQPPLSDDDQDNEPLDAEVAESLAWLDHNRNFPQMEKHWKITAKARYNLLIKTKGTAFDYIKKYPMLKDPNHGHLLVNIDFDQIYKSSASKFYENWDSFIRKVLALTVRKKKTPNNDEKMLLDIIDDETTDPYAKYFAQILLLPFAITPRSGISIVNKDYWKPTTLESQRGFAVHAKDIGEIEQIHNEKMIEMRQKQTTVQPYLVGVGNTLKEVNNFIVVLDKPLYFFDSPLSALATCFKIFYVWNVDFPLQSKQIWALLQHGIFKFETNTDEIISHVTKLVEFINDA